MRKEDAGSQLQYFRLEFQVGCPMTEDQFRPPVPDLAKNGRWIRAGKIPLTDFVGKVERLPVGWALRRIADTYGMASKQIGRNYRIEVALGATDFSSVRGQEKDTHGAPCRTVICAAPPGRIALGAAHPRFSLVQNQFGLQCEHKDKSLLAEKKIALWLQSQISRGPLQDGPQ